MFYFVYFTGELPSRWQLRNIGWSCCCCHDGGEIIELCLIFGVIIFMCLLHGCCLLGWFTVSTKRTILYATNYSWDSALSCQMVCSSTPFKYCEKWLCALILITIPSRLAQQRLQLNIQETLAFFWQRLIRGRSYRHLMKEVGYK